MLLIAGRIALGALFIFAAYAKMKPQIGMPWTIPSINTSLSMFAMGVDSYEMVPPWAVSPFAHGLPIFELVLGLWLVTGIGLRASSLLAALAIVVFFTAMFTAYERHLTISCGCFGPGEQIGPKRLVEEGLMFLPLALAVAFGAFWIRRKPRETSAASASA